MPYASADIVERLGELYWERYRVPIFIAETASVGSVARRREWLDESVACRAALARKRSALIGYTWVAALCAGHLGLSARHASTRLLSQANGSMDLDPQLNRIETEPGRGVPPPGRRRL